MTMNFPRISQDNPLVLASASPRRKRLLEQIALPFRVRPSEVEEEIPFGEPVEGARILAEEKARKVSGERGPAWVLGADTMVVVGRSNLGKPVDGREAARMLERLSARTHRVMTGFALLDPSGRTAHSETVVTKVRFKALTSTEIKAYIDTGEPFGKAGAYAIQGVGAFMIEEIRGSYTNVVGLPLCALVKALVSVGALEEFPISPTNRPR
jgi:septum formation protein